MKKYSPHISTRYKNSNLSMKCSSNTQRKLPDLYEKRQNCCGCSACFSICPVRAINMESDEEGFLYPIVDESICIRCYRCISVCAFKIDQTKKGYF